MFRQRTGGCNPWDPSHYHAEDGAQFVCPWYNPGATHFGDHHVRFTPSRQDGKPCADPTQRGIPTGHQASKATRDLPYAGNGVRLG